MRQRLLLIAGWAVAAVGSSVVASGAVAVAGGQVTDRPLRLLSASEVEAIPIVNTVVTSVSDDASPASGDSSFALGATDRSDTGLTSETLAPRQSPAGDEGDSGSSPGAGLLPEDDAAPDPGAVLVDPPGVIDQGDPVSGDPIPTQPPPTDPIDPIPSDDPAIGSDPAEAPATGTQIVTLAAGTVAVAGEEGRVELLWATPRPGYTVSVNFSAPDALVFSFVSEFDEAILRAFWSDGGLVVDAPDAIS